MRKLYNVWLLYSERLLFKNFKTGKIQGTHGEIDENPWKMTPKYKSEFEQIVSKEFI